MSEDRIWAMYHREKAVEDELQKAFMAVDGEKEEQLAALVKLMNQRGRRELLYEMVTVAYIEQEDEPS